MSARYIPGPGKGTKHYYHNSDSGVGSFSDQDNFPPTRPDRIYVDDEHANPADPWEQNRNLKLRLKSLEADLATKDRLIIDAHKSTREAQGHIQQLKSQVQGLRDHSEVLEEEVKKAHRERKRSSADATHIINLQNDNASLTMVNETLKTQLQGQVLENRKLSSIIATFEQRSPVSDRMSGANPETSRKHRKSSESKREKGKEREKEKGHREHREQEALNERLAARFNKSDEDEARRGRRASVYTEPFGPGGRPKRSTSAAPRVSRAFSNVAYQTTTEPQFSDLPRSTRRDSYRHGSNQRWVEDGNYHEFPLAI